MKRWIIAAFLVCFAGTAMANWNLRQQANGGTVWVNGQSVTTPVGGGVITVELDDISTASTAYIVTHRPGVLAKAYVVLHSAISGTSPNVTVFLQSTSDTTQYTQVSNPSGASLTPVSGTAGSHDSVTFTNARTASQGQVIAVVTDGGSTGTSRATITLVIE